MTREDIAQNVRTLFDKYVSVLGEMSEILDEVSDEEIIVFGSTIKAIEAESCEDCISRSYVINELIKHQHSTEFCTEHHIDHSIDLGMATIVVNNAPSVTPKRKWIPVNEKLPETNDDVLVYDGVDMFVAWYSLKGMYLDGVRQGWNSSDNDFDIDTPIIAWMPLPKPYKEVEE